MGQEARQARAEWRPAEGERVDGRRRGRSAPEGGNSCARRPRDAREGQHAHVADGAEPASMDLLLVVHASRAEQQVEVFRQPRAAETCRQQAWEADARAERCETELARVRAMQAGPDGLLGMREAGLLDAAGVSARTLYPNRDVTQPPEESLKVRDATVYRATRRMALELEVANTGPEPVKVVRAVLVGEDGTRLEVERGWPPEPLLPGRRWQPLAVEWEGALPPGPYTFELWDANGQRRVTLQGVTLP